MFNTLIDRNIDNAYLRVILKSLKGSFKIDVDTDQIDFDPGALRVALKLVETFKKGLEG